jgi:hypothetical protein
VGPLARSVCRAEIHCMRVFAKHHWCVDAVPTAKAAGSYGNSNNYNSAACSTLPCPLGFSCLNLQGGQYTCLATSSSDSSSETTTTASPSSSGLSVTGTILIAGMCVRMHSTSFPTIADLACVVACICVVLVVMGAVVLHKRARNKKEVLSTSDGSYAGMSCAAEVANPLCTSLMSDNMYLLLNIAHTDTGTYVNPTATKFDEPDSRDSWRQSNDGF